VAKTASNEDRTICTKGSDDVAIATSPDMCIVPGTPPPQPFPNKVPTSRLAKGATTTTFIAGQPIWTAAGELGPPSNEAHAGTKGGATSGTYRGEAKPTSYSADVFAEGKAVVRVDDTTTQNHANTVGVVMPAELAAQLDYGTRPKNPCQVPGAVGKPVAVVTGNMFLDQVDIEIAGFGHGLLLRRSYNSQQAYAGVAGGFGRGWTHSYEHSLGYTGAALTIREGSGVVSSFEPGDPAIEPIAGGVVRHVGHGGHEVYRGMLLERIVDAAGNVTEVQHDDRGRLLAVVAPGGRALRFEHHEHAMGPRIARVVGPMGEIARYGYDAHGDLRAVSYPDGSGFDFEYDGLGQLLVVTDRSGRVVEKHEYVRDKAVTSEGGGGAEKLTLSYGRDRTSVTDALGRPTVYDFAPIAGAPRIVRITSGSNVQTWAYAESGAVVAHRTGKHEHRYEYDDGGALVAETDADGQTTGYERDELDRVVAKTRPDGSITRATFGPAGPFSIQSAGGAVTTVTYTRQGKVASVTNPLGDTTAFEHDAVGDLVSRTEPSGERTTFGRDALGRLTSVTDAKGRTATLRYDARGRIVRMTAPDGAAASFAYDRAGRQTSMTDALGRQASFAWDEAGRLAAVTDPGGAVTRYHYDAMSKLVGIEDARGNVVRFEQDRAGRLAAIVWPGERRESFRYDAMGRVCEKTTRGGLSVGYERDGRGLIRRKTYSDGSEPARYLYDALDRLIEADNGVDRVRFTYDDNGWLASERSERCASTVTYENDALGNRLSIAVDGTVLQRCTYDELCRPVSMDSPAGRFSFAYDGRGTTIGFPNGVVARRAHDAAARTVTIDVAAGTVPLLQLFYEHDPSTAITSMHGPRGREQYAYDASSRLCEAGERFGYDAAGNCVARGAARFTYSERNELVRAGTTDVQHDLDGHMVARGERSYEWSAEGCLLRVLDRGVELATYAYDALGRRVEKRACGAVTRYVHAGAEVVEERSDGRRSRHLHGAGIDEHLAVEDALGWSYLHQDVRGSVVLATDSRGRKRDEHCYDVLGKPSERRRSGYAFTGREWDEESGLYYYRARYYDPELGRFLSEDPLRWDAGLNLYAYADNDPVNATDPYGMMTQDQCMVAYELLMRERLYGTAKTARMSTITFSFGDGLIAPFKSDGGGTGNTTFKTLGELDLDWYTDTVAISGGGPVASPIVYTGGKLFWVYVVKGPWYNPVRAFRNATNPLPFMDPGERAAMKYMLGGGGYASIFTPDVMAKECPQECCSLAAIRAKAAKHPSWYKGPGVPKWHILDPSLTEERVAQLQREREELDRMVQEAIARESLK
jgi:RHS repeat-associated protein